MESARELAPGEFAANRGDTNCYGPLCREPCVGNLSPGKLSLGEPYHLEESRRLRDLRRSNPARLQTLPHLFTLISHKGTRITKCVACFYVPFVPFCGIILHDTPSV